MQLFYSPDIDKKTQNFTFNKEESRHIIRVLRKKEEDILFITNGKGFLIKAEINHANDKKCMVQILSFEKQPKTWNYHLHIAIAPTKMNDRFEWFLEKATEIGIDEITPIICDNSERKVLKTERMQKVLVSAMKQSLKFKLGDFSTKEISLALQHQFIPLSLGSSRLRTETAGIVACSSISIINKK